MGHQRNVKTKRKADRALVAPFIRLTEEERLTFLKLADLGTRKILVRALKRLGYSIYVRRAS
jgi:hypothetical protein